MIKLICAVDSERGIGREGEIPWYDPYDLARFKLLTNGHIVIMGRHTWRSLGKFNRPLSNRDNYIVSSDPEKIFNETMCNISPDRVIEVCSSTYDALVKALNKANETKQDIWIIGGEAIYKAYLYVADELWITEIEGNFRCDKFFPDFDDLFRIVSSENHPDTPGVRFDRYIKAT